MPIDWIHFHALALKDKRAEMEQQYLQPGDIPAEGRDVWIRFVSRVVSGPWMPNSGDAIADRRCAPDTYDDWFLTFDEYPNKPMKLNNEAIEEVARITNDGLAMNWCGRPVRLVVIDGVLKIGPTARGYMPAEYLRKENLPAPRFHESRVKW